MTSPSMTPHCIGTPVSWLRLEQYVLDELPRATRREVEHHLAACGICRACLHHVDSGAGEQLQQAVRIGAVRARRRRRNFGLLLGAAALLASAVLIYRQPASERTDPLLPPARIAIKGGEVAIGLVRERDGVLVDDPERFMPGDRFRVLLTCPPGSAVRWEVVVMQAGTLSFPLPSGSLSCGNALALPGAFRLTTPDPASVCVLLDPPSRASLQGLTAANLPGIHVCQQLDRE
jgi:anti-sigma factor RsiW